MDKQPAAFRQDPEGESCTDQRMDLCLLELLPTIPNDIQAVTPHTPDQIHADETNTH